MAQQTGQIERRIGPSVALIGFGLVVLGLMLAFPEHLNVPPLIGYVTAGTLGFAGLLAFANAFCGRMVRAWLAVALLLCMALPSAWIAFGPGHRTCSIRADYLFGFGVSVGCRTAFGIASVFGVMLVLVAVRHALTKDQNEG